MDVEIKNIEAIKLPDEKKVKKLANINVATTFGSAGGLLSSLASGALDAAGLVGNLFGGGRKNPNAGKAVPKTKGLKLGGVKALGVVNAVFAGMDFAEGLQEGESVSKAAAGAGGNLAGSLIGGAIGQALIPVPGLGFVIGSMAGGALGGYLGDRAHEAVTGEGTVKEKTKARLKQQEQQQKLEAASLTQLTFPQVLDKFDSVIIQFERVAQNIASGTSTETSQWEMGETAEDNINYRPDDAEEFVPTGTGDGKEVFPLVGGRPNLTSEKDGGGFNSPRPGRKHNGQDIGVDPNTPVVASRSGKVIDIYPTYGSTGSAVIVKYDNGQQGLYGHVNPSVKKGDRVEAGQKIARVTPDGGNTHLHYMRKDTKGNYIDPAPILRVSKSGSPLAKVEPKTEKPTIGRDTGDSMVSQQNQMIPKPPTAAPKPTQNLSQMSTDQLKGMLDPTVTGAANPATFKAAQEARIRGQESGLSGEALEREVMMATIRAKNAESQVMAMSQQPIVPEQLQQYPDYNLPQSTVTIIPMMMGGGGGGGGQQRPMVISSGGGGGTTIMPPVPQGQVLNSLFKTLLLTNLSGS
jgi:murein DD-endopeptidase MepM/ murein hydrolase activator NlpD